MSGEGKVTEAQLFTAVTEAASRVTELEKELKELNQKIIDLVGTKDSQEQAILNELKEQRGLWNKSLADAMLTKKEMAAAYQRAQDRLDRHQADKGKGKKEEGGRDRFVKLLMKAIPGFNPKSNLAKRVLDDIEVNEPFRFTETSSSDVAFKVYSLFEQVLSTGTKTFVRLECGIQLDGRWSIEMPPTIVRGFETVSINNPETKKIEKQKRLYIVKAVILSQGKENAHREVENAKTATELYKEGFRLVPIVKVVQVILREGNPELKKHAGCEFTGLVMNPVYPSTLSVYAQPLSLDDFIIIEEEADKLSNAISALHRRGYAHMDIKEANVFVTDSGHWYIGDFGSMVKLGENIVSTSYQFLPFDPCCGTKEQKKASEAYDWFMFGVMLTLVCNRDKIINDISNKGEDGSLGFVNVESARQLAGKIDESDTLREKVVGYLEELNGLY